MKDPYRSHLVFHLLPAVTPMSKSRGKWEHEMLLLHGSRKWHFKNMFTFPLYLHVGSLQIIHTNFRLLFLFRVLQWFLGIGQIWYCMANTKRKHELGLEMLLLVSILLPPLVGFNLLGGGNCSPNTPASPQHFGPVAYYIQERYLCNYFPMTHFYTYTLCLWNKLL